MSDSKFDRRQLLKNALLGAISIPALAPELTRAAAPTNLTENDPTAQALGYHENAAKVDVKAFPTFKPTQKCSNCLQLQAGTGDHRPCNIFVGKLVNVNGWCKVWVQKT